MNTRMKNMLIAGLIVLSTGISITALDQETARMRELRALYLSGNLNRAQYPTKNGDTVNSDEALLEKNNIHIQAEIQSSKDWGNTQSQLSGFFGFAGAATGIATVVGCCAIHRFLTGINHNANITRKGKNIVKSCADSIGMLEWGFVEKIVDYSEFICSRYDQAVRGNSQRGVYLKRGLIATIATGGIAAVSTPISLICSSQSAKNNRSVVELNKSFDQNLAILGRLKTVKAGL